ncbi:hypothetical protein B0J13DRAFT_616375 [Dactylonectria estremocensis]|uniref:F-box domain-containing protein n=1 Tax=Dactylonectria estremocensis TaxID=1079267 RepID=A0A9P9JFD9_9HYPO|nr:hypothetical protein B0J13DRAFT_616375 [Dactylonectria estremocensis]
MKDTTRGCSCLDHQGRWRSRTSVLADNFVASLENAYNRLEAREKLEIDKHDKYLRPRGTVASTSAGNVQQNTGSDGSLKMDYPESYWKWVKAQSMIGIRQEHLATDIETGLDGTKRGAASLSAMPAMILRSIFTKLDSINTMRNMASVSCRLNKELRDELYAECGWWLNWLPLFLAAQSGDIRLIHRCMELGAPVNALWAYRSAKGNRFMAVFAFPLDAAIEHNQVGAVRWLLRYDAQPNTIDSTGRWRGLNLAVFKAFRRGPKELLADPRACSRGRVSF